ncbi:MAG: DUF2182 domain-containing protein [Thiohalocapsa sp.]
MSAKIEWKEDGNGHRSMSVEDVGGVDTQDAEGMDGQDVVLSGMSLAVAPPFPVTISKSNSWTFRPSRTMAWRCRGPARLDCRRRSSTSPEFPHPPLPMREQQNGVVLSPPPAASGRAPTGTSSKGQATWPRDRVIVLLGLVAVSLVVWADMLYDYVRMQMRPMSEMWMPPTGGAPWAMEDFWHTFVMWAVMLVLFAVGVMNMLWVAIITLFVLAEKVLPWYSTSLRALSGLLLTDADAGAGAGAVLLIG